MINPNRMHRAKGIVESKHRLSDLGGTIRVNGHILQTYVDLSKFEIGERVNIQASFSIVSDAYTVKTVRKIRSA